ncbi:hypothetical protein DFH06DRAFT_1057011 [Mycena polygramma]|nr:hypothetical protein DFH06DRAFT_1057011 [Mycena polygramma]
MSRAIPPHWPQSSEIAQKIHRITTDHSAVRKPIPRLGRKGFLYLQKTAPKAVKPEERLRITARRISKAERDERMDVTRALTPVKQYMSGFTRPSDLRSSNWFPGGAYVSSGKVYESPVEEAYEPHTVFLLESRYNVRYGSGRVEAPEYMYGVCREEDLPAVLETYNSARAPRVVLEAMDNARWPMGEKRRPQKRQKWWIDQEDRSQTLQELDLPVPAPDANVIWEEDDGDEVQAQTKAKTTRVTAFTPRKTGSSAILHGDISSPALSVRAFHSSSIVRVGSDSYNDDDIVPDFYLQNKQVKGTPDSGEPEPLQDSSSLMENLTEGILSDEIVASTRRHPSKIPVEIESEGVIVHPSGFVVPTPSPYTAAPERKHRERDLAQQTAAVAERVSEQDLADVTAETSSRKGKVPYEVRQADGTVVHPSGFEPPTAADEFEHSGNSTTDSHIGQQPLVLGKRGFHTTASSRAQEVQLDFNPVPSKQQLAEAFVPRDVYMPTLATTPLWRPLITLTTSTRPIAMTLVRLAKGLPTGRPFHADIDNHDKKCRVSYVNRMRSMRMTRIQNLAVEMAQTLAGMRGGVIGIRFNTESFGRGIGGEGLADPIPHQKRVIGVGLGKWYRLAEEAKEMYRTRAAEEIPAPGPFDIYDLDDFGNKLSETGEVVPWTPRGETITDKWKRQAWHREYRMLRTALKAFTTHSKAYISSKTGTVVIPAPKSRPRPIPLKVEVSAIEAEAEEDEVDLDFEEHDAADGAPFPDAQAPIVLMRKDEYQKFKTHQQEFDLDPVSFDEGSPLNFTLCKADGTPMFGPRGEDGKFVTEGTVSVPPHLARKLVQARYDMFCSTKEVELAQILAAQVAKVDTPNFIRCQ